MTLPVPDSCRAAFLLAALPPHSRQAQAAQPGAPPPALEVASVKRNRSWESGPVPIRVDWASGRFTATGVTLTDLIWLVAADR